MDSIRFLTLDEILEIHALQLDMFGGTEGVLDEGLLASAIAMPMLTFAGQFAHPDLPAMAAAYLFHLAKNHPFQDGNKRVAAMATDTFLLRNGLRLTMTADELADTTIAAASGTLDKESLTEVIRAHTEPFDLNSA